MAHSTDGRSLRSDPSVFASKPTGLVAEEADTRLLELPVAPRAFGGFVPNYAQQQRDRGHGRQNVGPLWGEQAVQGILLDNEDMVEAALENPLAAPNAVVEDCGPCGAPYGFAGAAVFTQEQVSAVAKDISAHARVTEANSGGRLFVMPREWGIVDSAVERVGAYADVMFQRVVVGDSGLHLAIRIGSLHAAKGFLSAGADAALLNVAGDGAADELVRNFDKLMNLMERVRKLKQQEQKTSAAPLTESERALLDRELEVIRKAEDYQRLAFAMAAQLEDRLNGMPTLAAEARRCDMLGEELDRAGLEELRREETVRALRGILLEGVLERSDRRLRPLADVLAEEDFCSASVFLGSSASAHAEGHWQRSALMLDADGQPLDENCSDDEDDNAGQGYGHTNLALRFTQQMQMQADAGTTLSEVTGDIDESGDDPHRAVEWMRSDAEGSPGRDKGAVTMSRRMTLSMKQNSVKALADETMALVAQRTGNSRRLSNELRRSSRNLAAAGSASLLRIGTAQGLSARLQSGEQTGKGTRTTPKAPPSHSLSSRMQKHTKDTSNSVRGVGLGAHTLRQQTRN